jgi:riboflavin kinase / FMN adenylyltransferase
MSRFVTFTPGMTGLGPAVIGVGVFDGVHVGHQALIRDVVALARTRGASSAVVTFDRDPDRVVDPANAAPQLLDLPDKLDLIAELGPDVVLVVPFTPQVAALTPPAFLTDVLATAFTPVAAVVGHDFRFGARAAGDLSTLETFGVSHGFDVVGHPLVRAGGAPVTSTRIRSLIAAGDVAGARSLLGRPHRVGGTVVTGRGAGTALGAATANLEVPLYVAVPAGGVYAGRVAIGGEIHAAAVAVGLPPTFPDATCPFEVHVLDFAGGLVGDRLEVEFLERLHEQRRFASSAELSAAIAVDVARVRDVFEAESRS